VKWDELTFEEWRRVARVNFDGLFLMCKAGSDLMRKNNYGRIVNFGSNSMLAGTPPSEESPKPAVSIAMARRCAPISGSTARYSAQLRGDW